MLKLSTIVALGRATEPQMRALSQILSEGLAEYEARVKQCKAFDVEAGIDEAEIAAAYQHDEAHIAFLRRMLTQIEADISVAINPALMQESA
jgi:hypothetical protein